MENLIIIGVGGTGTILTGMLLSKTNCKIIAIDTDEKVLNTSNAQEKILLGPKECRGSSAFSVIRGRRAAEESYYQLKSLLLGVNSVIIITGLGGGAGSGATPVIAEIAKSAGIDVSVFAILPFFIESDRRQNAMAALSILREANIPVIVHDNAESDDFNMGLTEHIDNMNNTVIKIVSIAISEHEYKNQK